ncbi:DUF1540 domain-containing protein [Aneurinibacillus sp. Ricciae_BoGa-3]|uniref:DUF1540 domain-containing protein n=1 Tax=Aneurinibacillus sp. Ricciae_BoGa-3 TaxID=3022697 RepID=UPI0023427EC3|nr:DUF1540 domain-containing protein [Aneurinibacillus sp. Ricciae_BoGa-3]WCK55805.1 DUF1540 domain-containing protein [Aneurinibacillus sp. Ricciae_BoGa-3]
MPQGVKCTVASCTYYAPGNNCAADAIKVEIDKHAAINLNTEIGEIAGEVHQDRAIHSRETCCLTFKKK